MGHASSLKRAISQDAARIDKLADKALKNIRRMQEMRPAGRGIVEAQMGPPPMGPAPGLLKHLAVLKAPATFPLGLSVRGHQDSVKASSPAPLHPRTAPVNRGCFPRSGQRVMATARAAGYHQIRT